MSARLQKHGVLIRKCTAVDYAWKIFISLVFFPIPLFAQEIPNQTYLDKRNDFEIKIPLTFERAQSSEPEALLFLRSKSQAFPTFNIVAQAGPFSLGSGAQNAAAQVLDSYRTLGLTDARVLRSAAAARGQLLVELQYTLRGEAYRSRVEIFSSAKTHYILTYIDVAADFDNKQTDRDVLFSSFKLLLSQAPAMEQEGPITQDKNGLALGILAALLGLGATVLWLKLRRKT